MAAGERRTADRHRGCGISESATCTSRRSSARTLPVTIVQPPRAWSTFHYSIVLLTDFARTWTPTAGAERPALDTLLAAATSVAGAIAERANLVEAMEFRPHVLTEALAQKDGFIVYFRGALSFSKATHPATFFLVHAASRIAEFVAMFYKDMYQRPRPSQLWPELMPPIEVPGHASFPSSHATQAATVALALQAVVTSPVTGSVIMVPSANDITTRLAQRIGRNREVLGLHYPSDSAAGRDILAPAIWAMMQTCSKIGALITAAQAEWQTFRI